MIKKRFILNFPPDSGDKPLSYHLVKEYDIRINILKAKFFPASGAAFCSNCMAKLPISKKALHILLHTI